MKEYQTPMIEEEDIQLEDIMAESGVVGDDLAGEFVIDPFK